MGKDALFLPPKKSAAAGRALAGVREGLWPEPLARLCLPCRLGAGLFWLLVARLFPAIDLVERLRGVGGRDCITLFL